MVLAEFVGSRSFRICAGSRRARARAPFESVFWDVFAARARAQQQQQQQ